MEGTHRCPKCKHRSALVTRWNAAAESYEVACGVCGEDQRFERQKSVTQMWRENPDSVPVHTAAKLEEKYGVKPMPEQALVLASETQMAERIKGARWLAVLLAVLLLRAGAGL